MALTDADDPRFPPHIRERLKIADETGQRNADAIRDRIGPERYKSFMSRLQALTESRESVWIRLRKLYAIADEAMSFNGPNVPCRRGCSHCCYTPVGMHEPEAQMLGAQLRRKPKIPKERRFDCFAAPWGPGNPCTFLVNGECSIYEHRPLLCRVFYSVDQDELLCKLEPPLSYPGKFLNTVPFQMAYVQICGPHTKWADIRTYFPPKPEPKT